MRKIFLALVISICILPLFAQDSTASVLKDKATTDTSQTTTGTHKNYRAKSYLLYNYTELQGNNAFNQEFRGDAFDKVIITGDVFANSKGVPAALAFDLLFNQPVSEALINRADKQLGNLMKFDESLNTGITYERYFKKADLTLVVGYNYRQMLDVSGPKQAFETMFYGNARFEGDTANLSNINFNYYNYNQLSLGIIKRIDYGSYQMVFGMTGSFLQVINNINIQTGPTSIYTAPYGEYVDINYNLTYNQATAAAPQFGALNGVGASGDFNLSFQNKDKWKLSMDIRDVGVMTFRKYEVNYSGTNNVDFQGFVIPNLLQFTSQTFDTLNLDSALTSKLPSKSNNQYTVFLPFTADLIFSKPLLNDRLVLTAGIQYRHIPNYYAYGYVKANYFLTSDMLISASAGAGGYSLFDLGFEFAKTWKYCDIAIGSSNLLGLIAPAYYSGGALYLKLGATF
jgi:hypothetical protein